MLRHQLLALLRRTAPKRPKLTAADRLFFVCMLRLFPAVRSAIQIVQPETVLRWHRHGFRRFGLFGEFQRQGKKELDDAAVVANIRKLSKAERETLDRTGQATSPYLEIIESYQPRQASEEEIRTWITANIDFSQLEK